MKKTLVIGATTKPDRYAYKAVKQLRAHGHEVIAFGLKEGKIDDIPIETTWNPAWSVDTVTLYINPQRLEAYHDQIIALRPKRVLFNPGTESPALEAELKKAGIPYEEACTLVLLSIGEY